MFKIYKNLYIYQLYTMQKQHIKLTNQEEELFTMLINYKDQMATNTTLRVAGGWVRDKIMGNQSHDVDIVLDNMKGEEFVLKMKSLMKGKDKISGFGVTKLNPDLTQINGQWIDFVNLRSQQYNSESRIPSIKFGTPKQDAQRRDFTINSMFYNLNTQNIQDWTERGFSDLQNGILRTPLPAYQTFRDDPLRILRCFRFKSRFNFTVEESIYKAIQQKQIRDALKHKVSKERIGTQLLGMLKAKYPQLGLVDILSCNLWNIVFEIPPNSSLNDEEMIEKIPKFSFSLACEFQKSLQENNLITRENLTSEEDKQQKKNLYTAKQFQSLTLLGCLSYVYHNFEVAVNKTKHNLTTFMVKDQLKYPAKSAKFAYELSQAVENLKTITSLDNVHPVIRWLRFSKEKWQIAIHLLHALQRIEKVEPMITPMEIRQYVLKNKLQISYLIESPVNGNFFKEKKIQGKIISLAMENAVIWKIIHPNKGKQQFVQQFEENTEFFISEKSYR